MQNKLVCSSLKDNFGHLQLQQTKSFTYPYYDTKNNDTKYNDTQYNDTQYNDTQYNETHYNNTQYNDTQNKDTQHYSVYNTHNNGLDCDTHSKWQLAQWATSVNMVCHIFIVMLNVSLQGVVKPGYSSYWQLVNVNEHNKIQ